MPWKTTADRSRVTRKNKVSVSDSVNARRTIAAGKTNRRRIPISPTFHSADLVWPKAPTHSLLHLPDRISRQAGRFAWSLRSRLGAHVSDVSIEDSKTVLVLLVLFNHCVLDEDLLFSTCNIYVCQVWSQLKARSPIFFFFFFFSIDDGVSVERRDRAYENMCNF